VTAYPQNANGLGEAEAVAVGCILSRKEIALEGERNPEKNSVEFEKRTEIDEIR
jgi:hypothetical protein